MESGHALTQVSRVTLATVGSRPQGEGDRAERETSQKAGGGDGLASGGEDGGVSRGWILDIFGR